MEIRYKLLGKELFLLVSGELDEHSALGAKEILDKVISLNASADRVVFDLSGLSFMDSTGVGLLIGRYKKLRQYSIPAYIKGASASAERVIELAGLYGIMPKY